MRTILKNIPLPIIVGALAIAALIVAASRTWGQSCPNCPTPARPATVTYLQASGSGCNGAPVTAFRGAGCNGGAAFGTRSVTRSRTVTYAAPAKASFVLMPVPVQAAPPAVAKPVQALPLPAGPVQAIPVAPPMLAVPVETAEPMLAPKLAAWMEKAHERRMARRHHIAMMFHHAALAVVGAASGCPQ